MVPEQPVSRKDVLRSMLVAAAATAMPSALGQAATSGSVASPEGGAAPGSAVEGITLDDLRAAERIAGIRFTEAERRAVLASVREARKDADAIRAAGIDYKTEPRTVFTPLGGGHRPGSPVSARPTRATGLPTGRITDEDLAYLTVRQLAELVRTRKVSPVRLTELALARLKKYGTPLLCVVNLTEARALEAAQRAEAEIAAGRYRGILHGIPYGLKDLFAAKGTPTTWGALPYADQMLDEDAAVLERLDHAGAILVAKLSLGSLAQGDVWHGGTTKNPWNLKQGSSGSSAGSACAVAAGLVPFAIGTETLGSIVSPSERCRVTGFRPTYGRVSRYGGMALSYTMDKVGPICRSVEDCALVFAAICGHDPRDASSVDRPFRWEPRMDWRRLKIGYTVGANADLADRSAVDTDPLLRLLRGFGADVRPVRFTPVPDALFAILTLESASAFDEFTRTEKIRNLKNSAWPNTFRAARYTPAVDYLQAQRMRAIVMERFERELGDLDAVLTPGIGLPTIYHTNFCGHPQVILPQGDDGKGNSVARSLVGRLYADDRLLAIAKACQENGDFHRRRPDLSSLG